MSELYKKRYKQFIKHRQENPLFKTTDGVYVEKHHIKPKSFFPKGTPMKIMDKDNTVYLTPREHFIAHCFLAKMYKQGTPKCKKMGNAIIKMNSKSKNHREAYLDSKLYERLKIRHYEQVNKEHEANTLIFLTDIIDWMEKHNKKPSKSSKDHIERKMSSKISRLKSAKRGNIGKFHKSYQDLVEKRGYPTLFEMINKEAEMIKNINNICDWADNHNGILPNKRSKDKVEMFLGRAIGTLRQAKSGKSRSTFRKSYQEVAEHRGYPNLFEIVDFEKEGLCAIDEICDWCDKNNKKPSKSSKDLIEKRLGVKICELKQSKLGNGGYFSKSFQTLANKRGYANMFTIKDIEVEGLNKINGLCDWLDENNKTPNNNSKDPIEKQIASKISHLKKAKQGKGNGNKFYQSYQDLVEQRGYPNLFDIRDLEKEGLVAINNICDWMNKYNKKPRVGSVDHIEKQIANKIVNLKQAKNGKGSTKFFESYQDLVTKRGYPYLFKTKPKDKIK